MVDGPSSSTDDLSGSPARAGGGARSRSGGGARSRSDRRSHGEGRTSLRPTTFGLVLLVALAVSLALRLAVADPSVMGLVWAGLAAVVAIGVLFPIVSVRLMRIEVLSAPTDLVVGQLSSVEVRLVGRASGLMLRCGRSPMFVVDLTSPDQVKLPLEVAERGAYDHIPIEVSTDAPFSILVASQQRIVALPRQLLVGPMVIDGVADIGEITGDHLEASSSGHSATGDTVRSVRPYVSGDPSHMVHWPSTARTGSLVVRELEPPTTEGVAVVVAIGGVGAAGSGAGSGAGDGSAGAGSAGGGAEAASDGSSGAGSAGGGADGSGGAGSPAVEDAVSRAAGLAINAFDRGARVMLCTATETGAVCEEIANVLDIQRRLALAGGGPTPSAPDGWHTQIVGPRAGGTATGARQ